MSQTEVLCLGSAPLLVSVALLAPPTHQVDGGDDVLLICAGAAKVHIQELGEHTQVPHGAHALNGQAFVAAGQQAEDRGDVAH